MVEDIQIACVHVCLSLGKLSCVNHNFLVELYIFINALQS